MASSNDRRYVLPGLLRFVLYFAVSAIGVFVALVSLDYQKFNLEKSQLQIEEALRQSLASRALQSDLLEAIDDLHTITALQIMGDYVRQQTDANRARVEKEFRNFAMFARVYDQIRFIDSLGKERIRVNYNGRDAVAVPKGRLQDKSQRYYFRDALRLKVNEIYISHMDLNMESGKIERPFKPMIRFAKPVYDDSGRLRGIVFLNYLATTLLNDFKEFMAGSWGNIMMVNAKGDWLSSPESKNEWGFMLGHKESFVARYVKAWAYINSHESGAVQTTAGLFVFKTVWPYAVNESRGELVPGKRISERYWKIITHVSPQNLSYSPLSVFKTRAREFAGLYFVVGVLSLALAWMRTNYITKANALRDSEEQFRELVEQASDGIFIADHQGRYISVNSAGCNMIGYTQEELIGKRIIDLIPESEFDRLMEQKGQLLKGDAHVSDWTLLHKDGHYLPVEVSAKILPDGRWQAFVRDISRRKRIEQQLHKYREQLEEMVAQRTAALEASNKELEAFSYSIAHDLRTPLRSITSFSQLLLQEAGAKLTAQEQQDLQRIVTAGKYMAQLIDDILELARIGRSEFKVETVDLSRLAHTIIEDLKKDTPERSVQVDITPGMKCKGDGRLLRIALENLLNNAWKYTGNNPDASIEFGSMKKGNETVYYVRDSGAGFDMQYVHKLFTAFGRLHTPREFEGAGIGLVSVQSAIRRHNGKVWAESSQGKGATFYFTLHAFQSEGVLNDVNVPETDAVI